MQMLHTQDNTVGTCIDACYIRASCRLQAASSEWTEFWIVVIIVQSLTTVVGG